MAIPESAFQNPRFIRYVEGATLSRDNRARFHNMNIMYASQPNRRWRIEPQPGYNARSPSVSPDRVGLSTDVPYIRAR
ncbi:hypothetical protein LCGC14_0958050 [marine sediment metagenome]|uniref:Uncharacterized protein n=1 Tax=marine sediment metagenome TaxID=412755 RepID=A0A0F9NF73_9ZZZZ